MLSVRQLPHVLSKTHAQADLGSMVSAAEGEPDRLATLHDAALSPSCQPPLLVGDTQTDRHTDANDATGSGRAKPNLRLEVIRQACRQSA
jgi:hypothetical protein